METFIKLEFNEFEQEKLVETLKDFKLQNQFVKQVNKFFDFWYKASLIKNEGHPKLISNMEAFYGEVIEKFQELPRGLQLEVMQSELPLQRLKEITNLKLHRLFKYNSDNKDFTSIFLTYKFQ